MTDDRTQIFIVGNKQSLKFPVDCSVRQGSIRGPNLLISCTEASAKISNDWDVMHTMFADEKQEYAAMRFWHHAVSPLGD
jgi:hypothetical protein